MDKFPSFICLLGEYENNKFKTELLKERKKYEYYC